MAVEANQISNLLAIARCGSFTRAAAEKGISQPALSNSIALLEQRLGVRVLERTRRGSTLTPYGEILVRRAEGVLSLLADAEQEVQQHKAGVMGPLRIGATPSVLGTLVASALVRLSDRAGLVDIDIVDGLDDTLVPMLRSGRIDVIVGPVADLFREPTDLVEEVLCDDPFALAVGPLSPYFDRDRVSLTELADARWILPRPGSSYRRHVEAMFMTAGVPWPRDCVLVNIPTLLETLVRSTDRITFISQIQIAAPSTDFRVLPFEGAGHRTIGYKVRRGARIGPLGELFLSALRDAASQNGGRAL